MLHSTAKISSFESPNSTDCYVEAAAFQPVFRNEDEHVQTLERGLLLMFIVVAGISILWHLGSGLQWLLGNCMTQLQWALAHAGMA